MNFILKNFQIIEIKEFPCIIVKFLKLIISVTGGHCIYSSRAPKDIATSLFTVRIMSVLLHNVVSFSEWNSTEKKNTTIFNKLQNLEFFLLFHGAFQFIECYTPTNALSIQ